MADTETPNDALLRSRLARTLTTWALIFLAIVALIALLVAGFYSFSTSLNDSAEAAAVRANVFIDLVKYLLATILPVVAGWVGTVLAFYYGKENFEAGTKSVTTAAQALTSKQKLAATQASSLGKARKDFKGLVLTDEESSSPENVKLDRVEQEFAGASPQDKPYERLPVMLAGDRPYMVLHRSTLNSFLVDQKKIDPAKNIGDFALKDLFAKVDYLPKQSIAVVGPDATAVKAKDEMEKIDNCSDVFVTTDGTPASAVARWITNVDLLKAAEI